MLIPFNQLFPRHQIHSKGVLHIGASEGQEAHEYARQGIQDMCFIEAIPSVYNVLKEKIAQYPRAIAVNACIGEEDGKEVQFNIADNGGQSSSYLEFGTHTKQHPNVHFIDKVTMFTKRIDTIYDELLIPKDKYDFLNADVQGVELQALKSMGDLLWQFKWAYLEVNAIEVYKGCALVGEIDAYMSKFAFRRFDTYWTKHNGKDSWGDCLFVRK